jgi:hypothetical protein
MPANTKFTRRVLGWEPNPELGLLKRLPILMRHYQQNRQLWEERNQRRNAARYEYYTEHADLPTRDA